MIQISPILHRHQRKTHRQSSIQRMCHQQRPHRMSPIAAGTAVQAVQQMNKFFKQTTIQEKMCFIETKNCQDL